MRLLVTGSTGFIGSRLVPFLRSIGHEVVTIGRKGEVKIHWDPLHRVIDLDQLEHSDAIINLAGENLAEGRWNHEKKRRILESRLQTTQTITQAIKKLAYPPKVFLNMSAVGFYGNSGPEICTENSPNGTGFLAGVCRKWEEAALQLNESEIKVVLLRTGVVLAANGGALHKMIAPFKLGLGGILGNGEQYMSWISLDDLISIILFTIENPHLSGPVNAVSPFPVTNRTFTKVLGQALNRPTFFSVPSFVLRLFLGEMADELLLASTRVEPLKLLRLGYKFLYPNLDEALKHMISHSDGG